MWLHFLNQWNVLENFLIVCSLQNSYQFLKGFHCYFRNLPLILRLSKHIYHNYVSFLLVCFSSIKNCIIIVYRHPVGMPIAAKPEWATGHKVERREQRKLPLAKNSQLAM